MITIGIRAAPKVVTFAVYDSESCEVINVEHIKIPAAFGTPDEPSAQNPSIGRIQIEGVIQETFASSNLAAYYVGHISSISARIGIQRSEFKPLVSGETNYDVENWDKMSTEEREAVLCAVGAVNA